MNRRRFYLVTLGELAGCLALAGIAFWLAGRPAPSILPVTVTALAARPSLTPAPTAGATPTRAPAQAPKAPTATLTPPPSPSATQVITAQVAATGRGRR